MPQPIVKPEDLRRRSTALVIQLVPGVWYRAACHACGWKGLRRGARANAEHDADAHDCPAGG